MIRLKNIIDLKSFDIKKKNNNKFRNIYIYGNGNNSNIITIVNKSLNLIDKELVWSVNTYYGIIEGSPFIPVNNKYKLNKKAGILFFNYSYNIDTKFENTHNKFNSFNNENGIISFPHNAKYKWIFPENALYYFSIVFDRCGNIVDEEEYAFDHFLDNCNYYYYMYELIDENTKLSYFYSNSFYKTYDKDNIPNFSNNFRYSNYTMEDNFISFLIDLFIIKSYYNLDKLNLSFNIYDNRIKCKIFFYEFNHKIFSEDKEYVKLFFEKMKEWFKLLKRKIIILANRYDIVVSLNNSFCLVKHNINDYHHVNIFETAYLNCESSFSNYKSIYI